MECRGGIAFDIGTTCLGCKNGMYVFQTIAVMLRFQFRQASITRKTTSPTPHRDGLALPLLGLCLPFHRLILPFFRGAKLFFGFVPSLNRDSVRLDGVVDPRIRGVQPFGGYLLPFGGSDWKKRSIAITRIDGNRMDDEWR